MKGTVLASHLEGKNIGEWHVVEKRKKTPEDSSGAFSSCYLVENVKDVNKKGFLKAFNYQYAFSIKGRGKSSADFLKELTEDYTYERDLLIFCKEHKMKRIVAAIDYGEYREDGELPVPYLVFEIADSSLKKSEPLINPDLIWKLRVFHGTLIGLAQLHSKRIAHQDIKPSNILIFGKEISKLSDLGNATQFKNESPSWNRAHHCGDMRFAPIELLYDHFSIDWETRRFGADLFMVGGIVTFLITNYNFLSLMLIFLPEPYRYYNFGGSYDQVLPHLMEAYFKSLNEIEKKIPLSISKDLIELIAQLCHPSPEERGNPRNLRSSLTQYSLSRYISIIDRLATKLTVEKMKI